ncbi:MAG TPA: hypothetical protein VD994_21515 [Prosthecobacter sp.]|nr:hypothetical protein [Prosthecobacter sp.]
MDRLGAIHEVKAIDIDDQVTVMTYQPTTSAGGSTLQQTMPMAKFLPDLEGQVPCPGSTSFG